MSFILDALKKSETDRQQQTSSEFASVPSSSGNPSSLKWLWILGALLLVNAVVLLAVLIRDDAPAPNVTIVEPQRNGESVVAQPTFEEQVAAAKLNQPSPAAISQAEPPPTAKPPSATSSSGARILTINEARLNGTVQLTDLHLDIHVYSDVPAERFVFINMSKLREGSQLDEGPSVIEITRDGVILEHQGTSFLLPRE